MIQNTVKQLPCNLPHATMSAKKGGMHTRRSQSISNIEETEDSKLLNVKDLKQGYLTLPNSPATPRSLRRKKSRIYSSGSFRQLSTKISRVFRAHSGDYDDDVDHKGLYNVGERIWYDDYTTIDWVHDSVKDAFRRKSLQSMRGFRGRILNAWDSLQGWLLVALIGVVTASVAYCIDTMEPIISDYKEGYCTNAWWKSKRGCCHSSDGICESWRTWSEVTQQSYTDAIALDFVVFVVFVVFFAMIAAYLTMMTASSAPDCKGKQRKTIYSASGSGMAEIKTILSGYVIHGYLGLWTLLVKSVGLVFSVGSGMSLGKEGPYAHIACCIGNVCCRIFSKYNHNDGKRREVLSAAAAAGVAVAFGSPLGGVLFSLEEVSYYFSPKTLWRTFFCAMVATLTLKFLDPYGSGKTVLFEVTYTTEWQSFELVVFILLGIAGGIYGALFTKLNILWTKTFRRLPLIKAHPCVEVAVVAFLTGCTIYWNRYAKLGVAELLFELSKECEPHGFNDGLCPLPAMIPNVILSLLLALVIKIIFTILTFGLKVPAGVYVPTMVIGAIGGRVAGLVMQLLFEVFPNATLLSACPVGGSQLCINPGIYAMVGAGAALAGVTRMTVTVAVIMFELTNNIDYVLPFMLSVLFAKWSADALEPHSIYDLLIDVNDYPYLDNKKLPHFTAELQNILAPPNTAQLIDITHDEYIHASKLRHKLNTLQECGYADGGFPLMRNRVLVGYISATELEFALDQVDDDAKVFLTATDGRLEESESAHPTNFSIYVDHAPVSLSIHAPMELVWEMFCKLGLRYLCVVDQHGRYAGVIHKKQFVRHLKELLH